MSRASVIGLLEGRTDSVRCFYLILNNAGLHIALHPHKADQGKKRIMNVEHAANWSVGVSTVNEGQKSYLLDTVQIPRSLVIRFVSNGFPKNRMTIGMGTYARGFYLTDPSKHGVNDPTTGFGKGPAGSYPNLSLFHEDFSCS